MKNKLIGILLSIFFVFNISCSKKDYKYNVVIDIDGAIDDMRSLTMFLSAMDVNVLAITCSQGSLTPEAIFPKVKTLLADLNCENIPVGVDEDLDVELPMWAPFAQKISWAKESIDPENKAENQDAAELISQIFEKSDDKITLIALGTLKTYADWLNENPKFLSKTERIVWYNELEIEEGFNYQVCPESLAEIKQTGIKLDIVGNSTDKFLVEEKYLLSLEKTNSLYANQIIEVHKQHEIVDRIQTKHLRLWDDFVPLYLTNPDLFDSHVKGNISYNKIKDSEDATHIYECMANLLSSKR